jgi:hypothetical protein
MASSRLSKAKLLSVSKYNYYFFCCLYHQVRNYAKIVTGISKGVVTGLFLIQPTQNPDLTMIGAVEIAQPTASK